jgi:hypothetical protein
VVGGACKLQGASDSITTRGNVPKSQLGITCRNASSCHVQRDKDSVFRIGFFMLSADDLHILVNGKDCQFKGMTTAHNLATVKI